MLGENEATLTEENERYECSVVLHGLLRCSCLVATVLATRRSCCRTSGLVVLAVQLRLLIR